MRSLRAGPLGPPEVHCPGSAAGAPSARGLTRSPTAAPSTSAGGRGPRSPQGDVAPRIRGSADPDTGRDRRRTGTRRPFTAARAHGSVDGGAQSKGRASGTHHSRRVPDSPATRVPTFTLPPSSSARSARLRRPLRRPPSARPDGLEEAVQPVPGAPDLVHAHLELIEQLVQPQPWHAALAGPAVCARAIPPADRNGGGPPLSPQSRQERNSLPAGCYCCIRSVECAPRGTGGEECRQGEPCAGPADGLGAGSDCGAGTCRAPSHGERKLPRRRRKRFRAAHSRARRPGATPGRPAGAVGQLTAAFIPSVR